MDAASAVNKDIRLAADAELRQINALDEKERELLEGLEQEIRELLNREAGRTQQYGGLGERLGEAVTELEASHPRATLLMRQVIDSLAYLGI